MTSASEVIADEIREHAISLARYSEHEKRQIYRMLDRIMGKLKNELQDADIGKGVSRSEKKKMEELFKQAKETIETGYGDISKKVEAGLKSLSELEGDWAVDMLNRSMGVKFVTTKPTTKEQLSAIAGETMIQGAPSKEWWGRQSEKLINGFKDQIRMGWMQGESLENLMKRLTGGKDEDGNPVFDLKSGTRRGAEAVIRTSVQAVANEARMLVYKDNADILEGLQWVSTLDTRTTIECAALDGYVWDIHGNPIGHDMMLIPPPRHWNCRSVLVPVPKSFRDMGIDLDEFPESTRASIDGQVPESKTFATWIKGKPDGYSEKVFGKTRADLWKAGKISIRDMVDQRGRPLPLSALVSMPKATKEPSVSKVVKGKKTDKVAKVEKHDEAVRSWVAPSERFMDEYAQQEAYAKRKYSDPADFEEFKKKHEAYQKQLEDLLTTDKGSPVIRADIDTVEKIIKSGRFKNQFEAKSSGGFFNTECRANFEQIAFSYPKDFPKKDHPIYGMFMDKGKECNILWDGQQYGEVVFVLKQDVKKHATFTLGDSLENFSVVPSKVMEPSVKSLPVMEIWRKNNVNFSVATVDDATTFVDYLEMQIHNTVTMADVDKIVFPRNPARSLVDIMEKAGLKWEVNDGDI